MKQHSQTNNLFLRITGLFVVLFVVASVSGLTLPRIFTAQAITPPNIISYQGRILNSNSVPVADANATMIFELYDASAAGTCLWSNSSATCASATGKVITLTDGLFSENLGDTGDGYAAIADSVFADNGGVYLQVTIGGEVLTPRKQISAAPYALNADTLDGIDSAGLMLSTGDTATGSYDFTAAELLGASSLQFEGGTDDNVYTTFAFTDPTVARTVTFKDESGTVAFLSDIGGASLFTDGGTTTYLTSATDDLAIGGTDPTTSPFGVDESAGTVYIGEGSASDGNIIFKASDADTGTLTYNTSDQFEFTGGELFVNQDADAGSIFIDSEATTADVLVVDALTTTGTMLSLVGANFTDDVGLAFNIDVTETTSTADIFNIQTNFSAVDNDVFRIEADGEAFSDVGFTAGAFSTNYFDAAITSTGAFTYTSPTSFTWNDDAANTLMTLTDNGTTGTLNVTGDITCTDCLDFTDFSDSLSLDSSTTITGTAGESLFLVRSLADGATEQGMAINVTAIDTLSATTNQTGLLVRNAASTEGLDQLIRIYNADVDDSVTNGLIIESNTGTILTGIDLTDTNLVTAIDLDSNFILYDGLRAAELSTGVLTWEDTAGNDLMTLTDGGATGTLNVTGDITCADCLDFTDFADSLALDSATTITGTAGESLSLSRSLADGATEQGMAINVVALDTLSATTNQTGFLVQNDASTEGLDQLIRIYNADADDSVTTGLLISSNTGTILTGIDLSNANLVTAIDLEDNFILYDTIRVAELSSGILTWEDTAGSDLMTLTTAGVLNVPGDITCADCFDYSDWADATSTLDATTGTQLGANNYDWVINGAGNMEIGLWSTGTFSLQDSGFDFFEVNSAREVDYTADGTVEDAWDFNVSTLTSGSLFDIDAGNVLMTASVIDIINAGTGSSLFINQDGDTGTTVSDAAGGAIHIANSNNNDYGLTAYTNNGATADAPLVAFTADHIGFDQPVVSIRQDGNLFGGAALYIDNNFTDGSGTTYGIVIESNSTNYGLHIFNDLASDTGAGIQIQACADSNPGAGCNYMQFIDGNGTILGAVEGDGAGGVTNASAGSDYAELFPGVYSSFSTGDILSLDTNGDTILATGQGDLIGAFSIAPNTLGNWFNEWQTAGTHVPVALLGQVPVNINMEGGAVAVGDHLAISSTAGVAKKATGVGYVLGTALESASADGQIMVFVQPKWHALDIFVDNGNTTLISEGLVLGQTATATAVSPGQSSNSFSLMGSAWNGASAFEREIFVQNDVTDSDNYKLSIKDDGGNEVAFINNEGDLSLSGKLYPSDRGIAQTDKYIFYDGSTGFGGDFMRTNASGWGSGSYDFAEMFPSRDSLAAGEVVVFADGNAEVARSTSRHYDPKIAGIISTQPGFLAGNNIEGHVPVALTGRVPTYVTTENGTIQSGDPLTTSSRPGYAMKATTEGQIVGYAMEGFNGDTGVITVFVRPSYYDGSTIIDAPAADNNISGLQGAISDFDVTGVLNMNGGSIINVASLSGISGIWELKYDGEFSTKGRFVHLIVSSQGELIETYPKLSTQTTIEITGTAQLTNGRARIIFEDIDPVFNDIISPIAPYRVFLTADSPTNPIYAIERDNDGFVIRETNGSSNATVDWMVIAYHKDFTPVEDSSIQGQDTAVDEPVDDLPAEEGSSDDPVADPEPEVVDEDPVIDPVEDPIVDEILDEEPVVEEIPLEDPLEELDPEVPE